MKVHFSTMSLLAPLPPESPENALIFPCQYAYLHQPQHGPGYMYHGLCSFLPLLSVWAASPTSLFIPTGSSQQEHARLLPSVLPVGHPGLQVHAMGIGALCLVQPRTVLWQHHSDYPCTSHITPIRQCTSPVAILSSTQTRSCQNSPFARICLCTT